MDCTNCDGTGKIESNESIPCDKCGCGGEIPTAKSVVVYMICDRCDGHGRYYPKIRCRYCEGSGKILP